MKKVILAVSIFYSAASVADTISIRADNWYPINGEPGSENPGFMIELAQTIFKDNGHQVDYQTLPWKRAVQQTAEGTFDCVVGAYKDDVPDFVFPKEHWGLDQAFFFVQKDDSWSYTDLQALAASSATLALVGGYNYSEEFDAFAKANASKVQYVNADNALENNIKKVLAGRATATIESKLVMSAKLKDLGLKGQLKTAGALQEPTEMYIACSPKKSSSQAYVDMIDKGTQTLRASGKLAEILSKYGVEDWK